MTNYRRRALDDHLRSVPIFASLTPGVHRFAARQRRAGALQQGRRDLPPGRRGRQLLPGPHRLREGVRRRIRAASWCWPISAAAATSARSGLLGMGQEAAAGVRPPARRSITWSWCASTPTTFSAWWMQFPDVRAQPGERGATSTWSRTGSGWPQSTGMPLDRFLAQGLMEAQSLLVLDLENCTRCDACVRACADAHDGVTRLIREGLRFDKFLVATSCRHASTRSAWWAARSAPSAAAIRAKSSSRTGASAAACAPRTARTATSTCIRSQ